MTRPFLDTNVLIYAVDDLADERGQRARTLVADALRDRSAVVSTQVLQEFFSVATRKLHIDPAVARRHVELFSSLEVVQVTVPLILEAIDLHRLRQISLWDALVVRAAAAARCNVLWTEDLQAGAVFDGVRVANPLTDKL
jgi:predicted nucleic acid-binding protein